MRTELLIIDMQNDFSDAPNAALPVPGACADAQRLADFIVANRRKIDDIHATLDTHQTLAIFHPIFWIDSQGQHPAPFTQISVQDLEKGKWMTTNPQFLPRAKQYVQTLADNKRYVLTIWNPHCLVGSWGHNLIPSIYDALRQWEAEFARVDFVMKGHNLFTEHYSAVQADVPDPEDPSTSLNVGLVRTLEEADRILISGEALNFCLANTVRDIADNFGADSVKKIVLLTDCTSPITGLPIFDQMTKDFMDEMTSRGMQTATTADVRL